MVIKDTFIYDKKKQKIMKTLSLDDIKEMQPSHCFYNLAGNVVEENGTRVVIISENFEVIPPIRNPEEDPHLEEYNNWIAGPSYYFKVDVYKDGKLVKKDKLTFPRETAFRCFYDIFKIK